MLESKKLIGNLDFFEELDERVSEEISGGASIKIDLSASTSGITDTIIKLNTSDYFVDLTAEIKKAFPNIDRLKDVEVSCLNRKCTVKANGKKSKFTLPKSSLNLNF